MTFLGCLGFSQVFHKRDYSAVLCGFVFCRITNLRPCPQAKHIATHRILTKMDNQMSICNATKNLHKILADNQMSILLGIIL